MVLKKRNRKALGNELQSETVYKRPVKVWITFGRPLETRGMAGDKINDGTLHGRARK